MFLPLLALFLFQDSMLVYSGRDHHTRVEIPRMDTTVTIDGHLDESVWSRAARLVDFSQYQPVDGRPSEEPTEVLVWYSGDAIYFGVRARELHGDVVRATHANRDNISSEDNVQFLLDTNNDRRISYLFGVNPLGVQQDGTRSAAFFGGAGGSSATGGGFQNINPLDGSVDLNPDYVFESSGRLVPGGYEVEIRIPFKSLRYQDAQVQTWGLHVLRRVQHSGYQDSWAPAVRANSNFLAQSGTLEGLHDMRRGLVLEATPTATGRVDGLPPAVAGRSRSYASRGDLSADLRWGIRQNLTLNGTINPDFSQVEADVGQVLLNERFALFYPEKRPFFLDGLELFDTPNQLIYTRRIVAPKGGVKLTGTLAGGNVATMLVADDQRNSWNGDHAPLFGIARFRKTVLGGATLGTVLTTREDGRDYSRLAGTDLLFYHSRLYFVQLQAVQSWTDSAGKSGKGSLVQADWDRTGRQWGFHYTLNAIDPAFNASAGFVNRTGIIGARTFNRLSFYGAKDALVQTYGSFFQVQQTWDNRSGRHAVIETAQTLSPSATLRGGWQIGASASRNSYAFDPLIYGSYQVERTTGSATDTVAFLIPGREEDLWSESLRVTAPVARFFSATASVAQGAVPIFSEAVRGKSSRADAALDLRPTTALRGSFQLSRLKLTRAGDGSKFSSETIPRLKVEYQLTNALFLRLVGQYAARSRAPLRDQSGNPVLVGGVKDAGSVTNQASMDWLVSYRPVPGTLAYLGYGSTLEEPRQFQFRELRNTRDGLFAKLSYLIRF